MYCLIVKRGDLTAYDVLYKAFAQRMPVVWERRRAERRRAAAGGSEDRRKDNRRKGFPLSWKALGFVVVER